MLEAVNKKWEQHAATVPGSARAENGSRDPPSAKEEDDLVYILKTATRIER